MWARVHPLSGDESKDVGRLAAKQLYLVSIRYRNDINSDNFIVWMSRTGDITLNIRSFENRDERAQFLIMKCEEGVE